MNTITCFVSQTNLGVVSSHSSNCQRLSYRKSCSTNSLSLWGKQKNFKASVNASFANIKIVSGSKSSSKSDAPTEEKAYKKRKEESEKAGIQETRPPQGGDAPPIGEWKWTLNWDPVTYTEGGQVEILVGSCPRTPEDILRLKKEADVEAMLSLQSDVCLDAMGMEWDTLFKAALAENIMYNRVPVYDFDRIDQAAMLPEMVRRLATNISVGRRTYVHCTAGINRATLTVLGYLTFVKGMDLEDALSQLQQARPQAHPYVECWKLCRERMLAGKEHDIYLHTQTAGCSKNQGGDWIKRDWENASKKVIMKQFERAIASDYQNMSCVALLISGGKKHKKNKKQGKSKNSSQVKLDSEMEV